MYKAVQGFKNRTLNKVCTLKPSYSYRDNKKIDEKKQNKRSAFLFLVKCQHLTIC